MEGACAEEAARDEEHAAFVQEFEFMTGRPWPRNSRLLVQSEKNENKEKMMPPPAAAPAAPAAPAAAPP